MSQNELVTDDATELVPVEEQQGQQGQEEDGWEEARKRYEGDEEQQPAPESDAHEEPEGEQAESQQEEPQQQRQAQSATDERFARLEAENAAMRQQIAALMGGQQQQPKPQPPSAAQQSGTVPIPESIRAEAKEFSDRYPEMGKLVTENSSAGDLVRRKLGEYGVDEAAAAAIPIAEARKVSAQGQQVVENVQRQNYWSAVSMAHPDVVQAINSGKGGQLYSELQRWAGTKPYAEGKRLIDLMQRDNDPLGTNEVLTAWKRDMTAVLQAQKKNVATGKPSQAQRGAMAAAIGAVPSGTPSAPRTRGEPMDESAQWEAARKRWG